MKKRIEEKTPEYLEIMNKVYEGFDSKKALADPYLKPLYEINDMLPIFNTLVDGFFKNPNSKAADAIKEMIDLMGEYGRQVYQKGHSRDDSQFV